MTLKSHIQQAPATPVAAALALLDCYAAGIIRVPAGMMQFQRSEIERELRVDAQILVGPGADDCAVVALTTVACFRRGIDTGALIVTRKDATPHVAATIAAVADKLVKTEASDGPLASLWFDRPAVMPAA